MAPNPARRIRPNQATQPVDPVPLDSAATQMAAIGMDLTATTQVDNAEIRSEDEAPQQRELQINDVDEDTETDDDDVAAGGE